MYKIKINIFIFLFIVLIENIYCQDTLLYKKNQILIGYNLAYFDNLNSGDFNNESLTNNKTINITYYKKTKHKLNWGIQFNYIYLNNFNIDLDSKEKYDEYTQAHKTALYNSLKSKVENYSLLGKLNYPLNKSKQIQFNSTLGIGFVLQKEKFYQYTGSNFGILSKYYNSNNYYLHLAYNVGFDLKFLIIKRFTAGLGLNYFNLIDGPNKEFSYFSKNNTIENNTLNLNPKNINLNFFIGYDF